ncbi:hypothetical protein L2E82_37970 [Cichorium intybus]|uniref:Uncharacterized protein n=1 Tax=Cichorium intybus TaxID=13427 RepID=A0ACB9AGL1_CICIN|nr:hypothetical protein L2E82_37970 [Cichorium intybus]
MKWLSGNGIVYSLEDLKIGVKGDSSELNPGPRVKMSLGEPGQSTCYKSVLLDAQQNSEEFLCHCGFFLVPKFKRSPSSGSSWGFLRQLIMIVIDKNFGLDIAVEEAQRAINVAHVEVESVEIEVGIVKLMGRYSDKDDEIEEEEEKSAKSGRNFNRQWTGRGRVLNQGEISIESGQEEGILQLDMWGLTPSEVENLPDFQMNNNDAGFGTMNYLNRQMQFSQQQFPAM